MMTDIEIAQQCRMHPIADIAATAGIDESYLEQYGRYKAKIDPQLLKDRAGRPDGKLILVTAINPTPAGEGKTTTSVGLADGLRKIGKNAVAALREPSLGPVFGVKGGAAGGGYAQVVPMEDINLHFTGDFHAIGAANNLLAAMLDNHIQQGNALGIDVKQITWKRCVDMNDRQLRQIVDGLGGRIQGVPREDGFDITVASEVMAVLCLASDITDLKARLGRMIVAYTFDGKPVTAHDLKAEGAMTALLKDALKPNLVQTLEGTPTLIHGGPFANIAHGCNSVTATRMALKLGDYVVTEAGFGADLGAEKFLDIKCRLAGLRPNAVVIVATVRALWKRVCPICCTMSTPSAARITCRAWSRSTPFPPTRKPSCGSWRRNAGSSACALCSPRSGPRAARAARRWPPKLCACANSRARRRSLSPTPPTRRLSTSSTPSCSASTAARRPC